MFSLAKRAASALLRRGNTERTTPHPAAYYYSVWLRHLVVARESGLDTDVKTMVEPLYG